MTITLNRKAFSLIEAAIVLAVTGLVIGGIWTAAASVNENRRQARAIEQFQQIVAAVSNLYGSQTLPATVEFNASTKAFWSEIVPKDMVTSAGRPQHPWGGDLMIILASPRRISFGVNLTGKQVATCVRLAPRIYQTFKKEIDRNAGGVYGPQAGVMDNYDNADWMNTPEEAAAVCPPVYSTDIQVSFAFEF